MFYITTNITPIFGQIGAKMYQDISNLMVLSIIFHPMKPYLIEELAVWSIVNENK